MEIRTNLCKTVHLPEDAGSNQRNILHNKINQTSERLTTNKTSPSPSKSEVKVWLILETKNFLHHKKTNLI